MKVSSKTVAVAAVIVGFVVGLAGPAAAREVAHKIDGTTIKTNSLPGNRIKSNTVTGKQIAESTLGHVPYATKAGIATKLPALVWHPLSLINGWASTNGNRTPAYAVDAQGIVHLQGAITGGSNNQPFLLPAGARPTIGEAYLPVTIQGPSVGELDVTKNGIVIIIPGADAISGSYLNFTSLEGVTYATD